MMEKAYSLFLCVLLILVLFLPSTAAGRALLQTAQTEGEGGNHGGNDGSKVGVTGSRSKPAPSKTGVSSPSKPTPVAAVSCGQGKRYSACMPRSIPAKCTTYSRNCH
uniref:Uncharacterized protein n=1 Tax=Vitis vinifera TaxID=29760 RepID=F6HFQ6_VITVI